MNKKLNPKGFFHPNQHLLSISLLSLSIFHLLKPASSHAKPSPIPQPPSLQPQTINTLPPTLAKLNDWRFYPEVTQLEFTLSASANPRYFYLPQPPRIVIDLPDTKLGYVPTQQNYSGTIQSIRVSQLNPHITRIVLDIAPGNFFDPNQVQLQPFSQQNSTRWVLRPLIRSYSNSLPPSNYPPNPPNSPQIPQNLPPTANYPQLPHSIPPAITNSPQPFVTVPPLMPNNTSAQPSPTLPPPIFPNQLPPVPNYPSNLPSTTVIEFGQPLPRK